MDDTGDGTDSGELGSMLRLIARADPRPVTGALIADRFRILGVAGRGGFGTVYRARDEAEGGDVALKVMRDGATDDRRFALEASLLASVSHPAVVSHVAHGTTPEGASFLAMAWLDGVDLSKRLGLARLSVRDALVIALRASEGLGAAHAKGAIHRDVKPSNLYLVGGSPDELRVIDFGIARLPRGNASLTTTGTVVGTPGYMAPEQARGVRDLSASVDVFALGCVLYECLTGVAPFAEGTEAARMARLLDPTPPRLIERWSEATGELEALLGRMLAPDPAHRFPDGDAAAAAIAAVLLDRTAGEQTLYFATVVAVAAPWAAFPSSAPEHATAQRGGIVQCGSGVMVTTFSSTSPDDAALRGASFARALADDGPSLRLGITSAFGVNAPLPAAVRVQLRGALDEAPEGRIVLDAATARHVATTFDVDHFDSLFLGAKRTIR